jgi:hypothetical protein
MQRKGGFQNYVTNVAAAVTGHEGFRGSPEDASSLYAGSVIFILVYLTFIILFGAGASSLSYNYNLSIGTSGSMTVVYAILAFFFSSLYYPYYALFLNPVKGPQKGGRR